MQRMKLGVAAVVLFVIALAIYLWNPEENERISLVLMRAGGMLLVLWLAIPDLQRVPKAWWLGILLIGAVIVWQGRAALYMLPILIVFLVVINILRPRSAG
jgi:xanthine/uracil permease